MDWQKAVTIVGWSSVPFTRFYQGGNWSSSICTTTRSEMCKTLVKFLVICVVLKVSRFVWWFRGVTVSNEWKVGYVVASFSFLLLLILYLCFINIKKQSDSLMHFFEIALVSEAYLRTKLLIWVYLNVRFGNQDRVTTMPDENYQFL